jgi:glycosyltransferase involved in cell wall biosynthesis
LAATGDLSLNRALEAANPCSPTPTTTVNYEQVLVSRELGGAGLTALHLAHALGCSGSSCRVWIPGVGPAYQEAARLGLSVEAYDPAPAFSPRKMQAVLANWRIGRRWRGRRPGILHIHGPAHYGALRHAVRLSGLKSVVHVQIDEDESLLRWAFRRPPHLVVTCAGYLVNRVRQAVPDDSRDKQRIEAVPNAVDVNRFFPAADNEDGKRRVGAPTTAPLALMLANLAPHKGQETAIRAIARLKERGIRMNCWLAGIERSTLAPARAPSVSDGSDVVPANRGPYTTFLENLAGELRVADRVRFLGARNDSPDLLRAADFFLLPSTHEGLPLSILEAQATALPVLAAPTAGVPECIQDGETGFLIPADDVEAYARRLEELLANRDWSRRVAQQALQRTTAIYNWRKHCQRMFDLYQELLGTAS